MDKQALLTGLKDAQHLLSEMVPAIFAWDAIKAVKLAVTILNEIELEGYTNEETV